MAKYNAIKAAVNAYIKENGRKEITGKILNAVLNATIDSLGRFFQFAGGALPTDDPGTPDQNVCYLAGEPGVYTHFGNIVIENEEVALLLWDGEWKKQSVLYGIREVDASVDNQVGTPSVDVSYREGRLVLTFHNLRGEQGETGESAGFGTIGADVDNNHGTPGVSVETSGDNTAKNIMFHFTNLKGETGVTSVVATIDDTSGTPSCQVSLVNGVLTLAFSGLKGLKGDTGVSADYPITIYNGLDSDATDQALSAAQGKILGGRVGRLETDVDMMSPLVMETTNIVPAEQTFRDYQINSSNQYTTNASYKHIIFGVQPGQQVKITAEESHVCQMAWLRDDAAPVSGGTPHFVTGTQRFDLPAGQTGVYVVPDGAAFMYVYAGSSPYAFLPQSIVVIRSKVPAFSVIDSFDSTSKTDALSADKGRELKSFVDQISLSVDKVADISELSNVLYAYIGSGGSYNSTSGRYGKFLPVKEGDRIRITANDEESANFAFLTSKVVVRGGTPAYVPGTSRMTIYAGEYGDVIIPEGCNYLQFNTLYDNDDHTPESITFLGGAIKDLDETDNQIIASVASLSEKVASGKIGEYEPDIALTSGHGISTNDGTAPSSSLLSNTDYISVENVSAIELSVCVSFERNTTRGIAFYDSDKVFIMGIPYPYDTSLEERTFSVRKYNIPEGAAYFRTCFYTEFSDQFKCTLYRSDASENLSNLLSDYLSMGGLDLLTIGSPEIYHHPEIAPGVNATTTDNIYSLYDALVSQFPQWITREENIGMSSDGIHEIRHYRLRYNYNAVWSLGEYNNNRWEEFYSWRKMLINAGTHGDEASAIWGVYFFVKALLEGDGEKWAEYIRSNIQIDIIPVLNPYGLDHNVRTNANGVDINRQFDTTTCVEAEALKGVAREIQPFAFIDCHAVGTTHGNYLAYLGGPGNGPIFGTLARIINNLAALFREDWSGLASSVGITSGTYMYCCIGQSSSTPERAVAWMTSYITRNAILSEVLNVGSTSTKGKPVAKIIVDILANLIPTFMKMS